MPGAPRRLELKPSHADARLNLGRLLQEGGRPGEAIAHYREVLAAEPAHPAAAFNLGTAFEDLNRVTDAIAAYRAALGVDATFADAHFNLARLYERTGRRAAGGGDPAFSGVQGSYGMKLSAIRYPLHTRSFGALRRGRAAGGRIADSG
ncbi:MAG: tetratricopeptide repeat protein [Gemmatimonadales bacterium]